MNSGCEWLRVVRMREVEEIDLCERVIAVAGGGDAAGENYN